MSKKSFSQKEKEQAVQMMAEGNLTQKQIAEKFGCSVPTLLMWRKNTTAVAPVEEEDEDWDDDEDEIEVEEPKAAKPKGDSLEQLKVRFWDEDSRASRMLLNPTNATPEEVLKLVNEALEYAYKYPK